MTTNLQNLIKDKRFNSKYKITEEIKQIAIDWISGSKKEDLFRNLLVKRGGTSYSILARTLRELYKENRLKINHMTTNLQNLIKEFPSDFAMRITEIILNKEKDWSIVLEKEIKKFYQKSYEAGRAEERKRIIKIIKKQENQSGWEDGDRIDRTDLLFTLSSESKVKEEK